MDSNSLRLGRDVERQFRVASLRAQLTCFQLCLGNWQQLKNISKSSSSLMSWVLDSMVGKLDSIACINVSFLPVVMYVPVSLCHNS